jgi:peroxin-1
LYGYSGCGKTFLAKSIAGEFKLNFIYVKGPEILDKYIGGSEANVRALFEKAESNGPSVLFFDEFDSIVPVRNSSTAAVTDRIVNQFLCYLDGVTVLEKTFVIAATARPDMIDPAILRPGRIDAHIFCDLPTDEDRSEFFTSLLQQQGVSLTTEDLGLLVNASKGFSFADMDLGCKSLELAQDSRSKQEIIDKLTESLLKVKSISQSKEFNKLRHIYEAFREHKLTTDVTHQKQVLK